MECCKNNEISTHLHTHNLYDKGILALAIYMYLFIADLRF